MSDWDDAQAELNTAGAAGFYAPNKTLAEGKSEEITVVRYAKWTQTKYPITDKDGKSLGYTWRFWLSDGRVWDVANRNRKVLLGGLHPGGQPVAVTARFKVTNLGRVVDKNPAVRVELIESVVV